MWPHSVLPRHSIHRLRETVSTEHTSLKQKELETMPKASHGYGGKFGVQQDRMDKVRETTRHVDLYLPLNGPHREIILKMSRINFKILLCVSWLRMHWSVGECQYQPLFSLLTDISRSADKMTLTDVDLLHYNTSWHLSVCEAVFP